VHNPDLCSIVHRSVEGEHKPIQPHKSEANWYLAEQEDVTGQEGKKIDLCEVA